MYQISEDHLRYLRTSRGLQGAVRPGREPLLRVPLLVRGRGRVRLHYTLLEPPQFDKVYGRYTRVPEIRTNLPGYVGDEMLAKAKRFAPS